MSTDRTPRIAAALAAHREEYRTWRRTPGEKAAASAKAGLALATAVEEELPPLLAEHERMAAQPTPLEAFKAALWRALVDEGQDTTDRCYKSCFRTLGATEDELDAFEQALYEAEKDQY